jgi:hypothetical protein
MKIDIFEIFSMKIREKIDIYGKKTIGL